MTISMNHLSENVLATVISVDHPDLEMKRRLYDLGFFPGVPIKKVLSSPKGDPLAYRVRGTTIALRNDDAQFIEVAEKNDRNN